MRPVYLLFKGFGPYVGEQRIDFESLEKSGLFLICGETGSGKTTILDAMTFALYGKSSGGGRDSLEGMRCNIAGKEDDTYIEFVFKENNYTYKFMCQAKKARKNISISQNSFKMNEEGEFVPLHENPTATAIYGSTKSEGDAQRIIGLSYEQFIQVIILPQGKFEKLLTSDSADKEKILVSIFHADKWQKISEKVMESAKKALDELEEKNIEIKRYLNDYECNTLEELEEKILLQKEEYSKINSQMAQADESLHIYQKKYDEMRSIYDKFETYDLECRRLSKLNEQNGNINSLSERLESARKAECIRPYFDKKKQCLNELNLRTKNQDDAKLIIDKSDRKLITAQVAFDNHMMSEEAVKEMSKKALLYESKKDMYMGLTIKKKEYDECLIVSEQSILNYEKAKKSEQELAIKRDKAVENHYKQMEMLQEMYEKYNKESSARLAEKLKDNEPCPVCGSCTHPKPAVSLVMGGEKKITDDDINKQLKVQNQASKAVSDIMDKYIKADEFFKNEQLIMNDCGQKLSKVKAEYEQMSGNRIEGINTIDELNKAIIDINKKLDEYEKNTRRLQDNLENAKNEVAVANVNYNNCKDEVLRAKTEYDESEQSLKSIVKQNRFDSEIAAFQTLLDENVRNEYQRKISEYHALVKELGSKIDSLKKEISQSEKPDISLMNNERTRLQTEKEELYAKNALLNNQIKTQQILFDKLKKQYEKIEEQINGARANMEFAKQLRGDKGVGIQRYVLGVMLSSVTEQANKLLENVHGGRYRLFRTDEASAGKRKSGLELAVYDANADGLPRSVKGLSGGEKFLVALSLSIGLSTVAQKNGMKLDAMFIDEGFGSLDRNSINDALDVLGNIQRANGLVGIISHVSVLRDNIPVHIEIIKDKDGSRLINRHNVSI